MHNLDPSQIERRGNLFQGLDALQSHDILALHRVATEDGATSSQLVADFDTQRKADVGQLLDVYLDDLPPRNIERAKVIFNLFASSPDVRDRYEISDKRPRILTEHDHDTGIDLWDRLIRDPDPNVRRMAFHELQQGNPASIAHWGLDLSEVESLTRSYERAAQGENLHDPLRYAGELALKKLIERLDAPDQPL